jgi:hypothetical protein
MSKLAYIAAAKGARDDMYLGALEVAIADHRLLAYKLDIDVVLNVMVGLDPTVSTTSEMVANAQQVFDSISRLMALYEPTHVTLVLEIPIGRVHLYLIPNFDTFDELATDGSYKEYAFRFIRPDDGEVQWVTKSL